MLVRACALGQASSSLMAASVIGKTPEELAAARDALTAWLAGEGPIRGLARLRDLHACAAAQRPPRLDPARLRGRRRGRRQPPAPAPPHDAKASLYRRASSCSASAWSSCCCSAGSASARPSAISSPARWSGRRRFGLVDGAEAKIGIAELGITLLLFIVGLELNPTRLWRLKQRDFRARPAPGRALRRSRSSAVVHRCARLLAGRRARARPAAGAVLDRAGAAAAAIGGTARTPFGERAFSILLFQDLSIVPLITIIAAMSRNPADAGGAAGLAAGVSTPCSRSPGWSLAGRFLLRPLFRLIGNLGEREMFVFAGLFTVIAARRGDGGARPVDRARRLRRRRDAGRFALPARARGRRRAVPLDPARPVLPRGRHDARSPRHRRRGRCSWSAWRWR